MSCPVFETAQPSLKSSENVAKLLAVVTGIKLDYLQLCVYRRYGVKHCPVGKPFNTDFQSTRKVVAITVLPDRMLDEYITFKDHL